MTAFEVDHIIPLSAGGSNDAENVCLACPACNRFKAARQEAADPRTGLLAPLGHPRSQSWHDHFAWIDDASQIEGLTPTGRATVVVLQMNRPQMVHLRRLWRKMGYVLA